MRLLMAKMIYNFDFELDNGEENWYVGLKAYTVWDKGHLNVRLTLVKH